MDEEDLKIIKGWRFNWLTSLLALADLEFQKERWLDKKITCPAWTYVEFMCCYFDDCNVARSGYEWCIEAGYLSRDEYECIKDFHNALYAYKEPNDDSYDHEAIVNDQKWQDIVSLGKHSVEKLRQLITDPEEEEIFSKKLYAPALTEGDYTWPN